MESFPSTTRGSSSELPTGRRLAEKKERRDFHVTEERRSGPRLRKWPLSLTVEGWRPKAVAMAPISMRWPSDARNGAMAESEGQDSLMILGLWAVASISIAMRSEWSFSW